MKIIIMTVTAKKVYEQCEDYKNRSQVPQKMIDFIERYNSGHIKNNYSIKQL